MYVRKITENIRKLKPKECTTFMALALKSDYHTLKSSVNENTLAEELGVSLPTIKRHIKKFKDEGLIYVSTKCYSDGNSITKKNYYQLSVKHYDEIDVKKLLDLPVSAGFLALLKAMCLDCTNVCKLVPSALEESLTIGKRRIEQYLKEAEDLGYIKNKEGVITLLDETIFRIPEETQKRVYMSLYPEAFSEGDFDGTGHYKEN